MKRRDDGVDVSGKIPGFYLYVDDFERDVQMLSLSATGLWIRMLCWMHHSPSRGHLLLPSGAHMNPRDISRKSGKTIQQVVKALEELERIGLFHRDENGVIFNKRMVHDTHVSQVRKDAANVRLLGASRSVNGQFAGSFDPAKHNFDPATHPATPPPKAEQNTVLSSSSSSSNKKESVGVKAELSSVAPKTPAQRNPPTAYEQNLSLEGLVSWTKMRANLEAFGIKGGPDDWAIAQGYFSKLDTDEKQKRYDSVVERIKAEDFFLAGCSTPQKYLENNYARAIRGQAKEERQECRLPQVVLEPEYIEWENKQRERQMAEVAHRREKRG